MLHEVANKEDSALKVGEVAHNQLEAVIFDMDGVLVSSEVEWEKVFRGILAEHGKELSERDRLDLYGCSDKHENLVLGRIIGISVEEMGLVKHAYCNEHPIDYGAIAMAGGRELVSHLKDVGLKTALASSSSEADVSRMLDETGMVDLFDAVVTGDHVERPKPDPEIYRLAARTIDVPPERAIAVDDSPYGASAALGAGLNLILFNQTSGCKAPEGTLGTCTTHEQVGRLIDEILERGYI